ncbi:hypothetical protein BC938DRAFT_474181 [Jimgerdemannia flammicorona]|uniref:Uncharacterized protein n=1 Tax=Jimgerdemannia flammicorona TaxID=994334 RepID=A0A433Q2R9_9FUNG|nr:hypothetical protein BC938DRAFT_474181 [Jimgerdemannia flammicorona]
MLWTLSSQRLQGHYNVILRGIDCRSGFDDERRLLAANTSRSDKHLPSHSAGFDRAMFLYRIYNIQPIRSSLTHSYCGLPSPRTAKKNE